MGVILVPGATHAQNTQSTETHVYTPYLKEFSTHTVLIGSTYKGKGKGLLQAPQTQTFTCMSAEGRKVSGFVTQLRLEMPINRGIQSMLRM